MSDRPSPDGPVLPPTLAIEPEAFATLRELAAGGYVPVKADLDDGGILLRHDSAPDMVLYPDGRIAVPLGQPPKGNGSTILGAVDKRKLWRLGLLFLLLSAALSFLSVFLATLALDAFGRP